MGSVLVRVVDANTGREIRRYNTSIVTLSKNISVSAGGYTPKTVQISRDQREVTVRLVPRFRAL